MAWECKLLDIVGTKHIKYDPPKENGVAGETMLVNSQGNEYRFKELPIGTMFFVPKDADTTEWPWHYAAPKRVSDYYHQHNSHRDLLFVILPGNNLFLVDGKCWRGSELYGGWTVHGEAPLITVQPSININGFYHGYLTNGIIGDDVEGRHF